MGGYEISPGLPNTRLDPHGCSRANAARDSSQDADLARDNDESHIVPQSPQSFISRHQMATLSAAVWNSFELGASGERGLSGLVRHRHV